MRKTKVDNLLAKLAGEESKFFNSEFLGPVLKGQTVRVKLSGVVLTFSIITPKNFEGWGVYSALSPKTAKFVREPKMKERQDYLELFPSLRLILCGKDEEQWLGIPANSSDTRFKISGFVPIRLPREVQMFETIQARFDGTNCWFEQTDASSLRNAVFFRQALSVETDPAKVVFGGSSKEEHKAYAIAFLREIEAKKDRNEERIKLALERAGAEYRSYIDRGDTYTVEYVVNGEQHRSVVSKNNLSVQSAGICLSGGDAAFDLQSLVSVIKEGQNRSLIVRVGDNRNLGHVEDDHDDDYDD